MNEQEVAVKLIEVETQCKSNMHRLDNVEKRQNALDKLAESIGRMDERQNAMDTDVKEIKVDVKTITQKSVKRWDGIVDKALWLLIGAALNLNLNKIKFSIVS